MSSDPPVAQSGRRDRGLVVALMSAAAFATSGVFAASLLRSGWSPGAAVTARLLVAAVALAVPSALQMRGRWQVLTNRLPRLAVYGLVPVAGCQLCFFQAIRTLPVAVALLIEYSGTLMVVAWMWARHRQTPGRLTLFGAASAIAGLCLILRPGGAGGLDTAGLLWALGAAGGLASYFVMSSDDRDGLPSSVTAWAGLSLGGLTMVGLGLVHVVSLRVGLNPVTIGSVEETWLVPVLGLGLVAAALAYPLGVAAARMVGARMASFIGLTEVVFAGFYTWVLMGQRLGTSQLIGGGLILVGIAVIRGDQAEPDAMGVVVGATDPLAGSTLSANPAVGVAGSNGKATAWGSGPSTPAEIGLPPCKSHNW